MLRRVQDAQLRRIERGRTLLDRNPSAAPAPSLPLSLSPSRVMPGDRQPSPPSPISPAPSPQPPTALVDGRPAQLQQVTPQPAAPLPRQTVAVAAPQVVCVTAGVGDGERAVAGKGLVDAEAGQGGDLLDE